MRAGGQRRISTKRAAIGFRKKGKDDQKSVKRLLLLMILGGIGGALFMGGLCFAALQYMHAKGPPEAAAELSLAENPPSGHLTREDVGDDPPAATASTQVTAIDGVPGMTTYRLIVRLGPRAASIFSIFGDASTLGSMNFPASYQAETVVDQDMMGMNHTLVNANIGGTDLRRWAASPTLEFDSWLTVGITDALDPCKSSMCRTGTGRVSDVLDSTGIDFEGWSIDRAMSVPSGSVYWRNPDAATPGEVTESGAGREVVVAQLTVPTGSEFVVVLNARGRSLDPAGLDWEERLGFSSAPGGGSDTTSSIKSVADAAKPPAEEPPPRSYSSLIGTGTLLGTVHVLSGPDHLSALMTLSVGGSWRAFALGARWGCGHSLGLVIMTVVFFTFDVDLEAIGPCKTHAIPLYHSLICGDGSDI